MTGECRPLLDLKLTIWPSFWLESFVLDLFWTVLKNKNPCVPLVAGFSILCQTVELVSSVQT